MKKFELKPFDKVLVRDKGTEHWRISLFAFYEDGEFPYCCMSSYYAECIPYEGNEHLLGTTDPYEPPYEPKDGDFVYVKCTTGREYVLIKGNGDEDKTDYYFSYCLVDGGYGDSAKVCCDSAIVEIRLVTEEEKKLLLSKLHEIGKDWDAEKKDIVEWKWNPSDGEIYYYPSFKMLDLAFSFNSSTWHHDELDLARMKRNLVCRTEEECQTVCDKLNAALESVEGYVDSKK